MSEGHSLREYASEGGRPNGMERIDSLADVFKGALLLFVIMISIVGGCTLMCYLHKCITERRNGGAKRKKNNKIARDSSKKYVQKKKPASAVTTAQKPKPKPKPKPQEPTVTPAATKPWWLVSETAGKGNTEVVISAEEIGRIIKGEYGNKLGINSKPDYLASGNIQSGPNPWWLAAPEAGREENPAGWIPDNSDRDGATGKDNSEYVTPENDVQTGPNSDLESGFKDKEDTAKDK